MIAGGEVKPSRCPKGSAPHDCVKPDALAAPRRRECQEAEA